VKYGLVRALFWAASYLALVLAPLAVAYHGPIEPRGFWVEFAVGLGFVGLAMLGWQFVLTGRVRRFAPSFGLDSMLQYHRQIALVAVMFILAHPAILFLADPEYLEYLDPRVNPLRALALSAAVGSLLLLVATSLWRLSFGLNYEAWRVAHGMLASFVLFVGVVHVLQVGYHVSATWKQVVVVGMSGAAVLLLVNTRLVRPLRMRNRPYRVRDVVAERSDAWTLTLEPDGHEGMSFRPGQFAWLTLQKSPFSLQQHPYTFSSSAEAAPDRLSFTVKPEGDFSSTVERARPGWTAFLEGPYGCFVPDPDPGRGCVMIAGGVGITPMMSMLSTFADRGDPRDLHLLYLNVSIDDVIFHDRLAELEARLNLKLIHVLEEAPDGWKGETGLLDRELLERLLPNKAAGHEFFICGPDPMMDIAEASLIDLGIPQRRILTERFNMV
jgi:predicted ferric reductase